MAVWKAEHTGLCVRPHLLQLSQPVQTQPRKVTMYCKVCHLSLSSPESFYKHCASLEHAQLVAQDTTTRWRGLCMFSLCLPQTCEYGSKCPKAHSMEELQEWMMRAAEEKEIRHNIQAQGLMSYNDRLLEEYKNSSNEVYIVSIRLESTVNNLRIVLKNFLFDRVCRWITKVYYSLWQHFHHRNFLQLLKAHRLKLSIRVMTFCNCDMLQPLTFLTDKVVVSGQVLE
uniref:C3H1-type domain-containing protein n=1 Tax=Oreochromis niloticus TaxID=8128 RepID=A0A669EGR9_ORENI